MILPSSWMSIRTRRKYEFDFNFDVRTANRMNPLINVALMAAVLVLSVQEAITTTQRETKRMVCLLTTKLNGFRLILDTLPYVDGVIILTYGNEEWFNIIKRAAEFHELGLVHRSSSSCPTCEDPLMDPEILLPEAMLLGCTSALAQVLALHL